MGALRKLVAWAVLMMGVAGAVASCGDSTDSRAEPTATEATKGADHNAADVTFASEMILHHQQAAQMSSMAAYQANSSSVKKLAAQLDVVRAAEVKQLSAWLTGWGAKIPEQSHSHEVSLPGVMTEDEWSEVGRAEGLAFDRLWLRMMIRHHQGAITMAKAGERAGQNSAVVALAKKMQVDQTAEVAAMQQLLGRLVVR